MALKDWKKVKRDKCFVSIYFAKWQRKNWNNNPGSIGIRKLEHGWGVTTSHPLKHKSFRTKSQALKFARSYMRKH